MISRDQLLQDGKLKLKEISEKMAKRLTSRPTQSIVRPLFYQDGNIEKGHAYESDHITGKQYVMTNKGDYSRLFGVMATLDTEDPVESVRSISDAIKSIGRPGDEDDVYKTNRALLLSAAINKLTIYSDSVTKSVDEYFPKTTVADGDSETDEDDY
jgi:hypothetical protein